MSSTETLDMHVRRPVASPSEAASNNGSRKKSILKKSDSGSHHYGHRGAAPAAATAAAAKDPERENLLVSEPESANNTPMATRKQQPQQQQQPPSVVDLPPTVNHDQLKSLTGPKLRTGAKELRKPILVTSSNNMNNNKNNGSVASKEIQTSTVNLMALATASSAQTTNNNISNSNNSDNSTKKFERVREVPVKAVVEPQPPALVASDGSDPAPSGLSPVFKCPNDMCRHNKPSTASATATSKRKICLCGRTMVNQSLLHNSSRASEAPAASTASSDLKVLGSSSKSSKNERISSSS
jgi:hypothetical protein